MATLPGFKRVENGRAYIQESTGTRFTRRNYDKIRDAVRGHGPIESQAKREGAAASRARAEEVKAQAAAAGLEIGIRQAQRLNKRKADQEVKQATKRIEREQKQPSKPVYQPFTVKHTVSGNGKFDIFSVGKTVADVAEAEQYEPYRPQLADVARLVNGLLDSQAFILIAGGVLRYIKRGDDGQSSEAIEYISLKTTAGAIRKLVARLSSPEELLKRLAPQTDPVIVTYWSRAVKRVGQAYGR